MSKDARIRVDPKLRKMLSVKAAIENKRLRQVSREVADELESRLLGIHEGLEGNVTRKKKFRFL